MARTIDLSARAKADVASIFDWIKQRSPDGASRWYRAFLDAIRPLGKQANSHGTAPEAELLGIDLRQTLFKTSKGRIYRALFVFDDEKVHIVGIRGAGQNWVSRDDIELP